MSKTVTFEVAASLTTIECCSCHCLFAMTDQLYRQAREQGTQFYCPQGHPQLFRESDIAKLKAQLAEANRQVLLEREWKERESLNRQAAERELAAAKGQNTKLRKRVANGVCPCCQRSFENLRRHMDTKHPDYTKEGTEKA